MKTLIVEDDFTSRFILQEILKNHGQSHIAVDGLEAVEAMRTALQTNDRYDLILLDIMMPNLDGQGALKQIRALEESYGINSTDGVKVIMTTAIADVRSVGSAYYNLCNAYLVKPIDKNKLLDELKKLGLIK